MEQGSNLSAAMWVLDAAEVPWVLLRHAVPGLSTSDDIDILVHPTWASHIDGLLRTAGFLRLPSAGQGTHRFYVGYDPSRDAWTTLDVVTDVAFGPRLEFPTDVTQEVLARARRIDGISLLDPDDSLWHRLLHYLLDKPRVPAGGHAILRTLAFQATAAGPLARLVDALAPAGTSATTLLGVLRGGDSEDVDTLAAPLRSAWARRDRRRVRRRVLESLLARAHVAVAAGADVTGMTVAILGPDGAGKTTLAESLLETVPLPGRTLYMGVWREYAWDVHLSHVPGARLAARTARLGVRSLQCEYHRLRDRLVLLDRYTIDAALPNAEHDWRARLTASIARRLSRSPDVILLLDAPPEVMYERKGEQGLAALARDRESYVRLVAKHPATTVIDATASPARVRAAAHFALWRALVDRSRATGT